MPDFAVIIADIKASRKMSDHERWEGQLFLKSAIVQINETYTAFIEAPFMITKGDEFQGVLKDLTVVHELMDKFEQLVHPLDLRFGIGHGKIYKMGSRIPIEMDGPAFHHANAALNFAKKKKLQVRFQTDQAPFDLQMNTIYRLVQSIKRGWNTRNYKRYWKYKELGTFQKVAEREGVSVQAVWESLYGCGALDVLQAEKAIRQMLQEFSAADIA